VSSLICALLTVVVDAEARGSTATIDDDEGKEGVLGVEPTEEAVVEASKLSASPSTPSFPRKFAQRSSNATARKDNVVVAKKVPFKERISVTINAFWSYLLAIVIIGGMKMGIVTPTEAAVVAVVYSLFVGLFIYREIKFKDLYRIILSAAKTSSVVMFLVAAALVSAWLITVANIPAQIVEILRPFIDNKTLLMVMLMLLVMIVGTALDFAPTVLILTPVLMPLVREAGIDPVYFGVLFIMNNAIGLLTPPVGTVLNVVCGVGRIPMHDVIRGVMPFLLSQVVVMGSLIAFPSLVMVPLKWMLMR
jgi:tripartite ATP-independent transporter DctM subunit